MPNVSAAPDPVDNGDDEVTPTEPLEGDVDAPLLVLGDEVFTCTGDVNLRLLIRYADQPLMQMHKVLERAVPEEEHERMWDAFEAVPDEVAMEAVGAVVQAYSNRPTKPPSRSSRGRKSIAPKS